MYDCKWDFCPRSFTSLPALRAHFREDHIPREQPVFIPSHARQIRPDGAWVLVENSYALDLNPASSHASSSFPISSDSSSSFIPSSTAASAPGPLFIPDESVDFDAFLRSPTPNETNFPPNVRFSPTQQMRSSWGGPPMSFPSPAQASQASASGMSSAPSSVSRSQGVSSASGVSAADDMAMPTQAPAVDKSDPAAILSFGSVKSHARRVSGGTVGFEWGVGK